MCFAVTFPAENALLSDRCGKLQKTAAFQEERLPVKRPKSRTTTAAISSKWTKPPSKCVVKSPTSHKTKSITAIVYSMGFLRKSWLRHNKHRPVTFIYDRFRQNRFRPEFGKSKMHVKHHEIIRPDRESDERSHAFALPERTGKAGNRIWPEPAST